jgi:uncharacterized oxidoreductase
VFFVIRKPDHNMTMKSQSGKRFLHVADRGTFSFFFEGCRLSCKLKVILVALHLSVDSMQEQESCPMDIKDKRVIVTGGGSGIGLELALAFVRNGATVYITGRREKPLTDAAAANAGLIPVVCDVTIDEHVISLKELVDAAGGADILVNNAGVMEFFNVLDGFPLEKQIKEIDIDVVGPIRMIQNFLPSMVERESTIINVSSGLAYVPFARAPVYSGAKAFVHAYTQSLREQLKGTSVRVVELLPPVVDTPLAAGIESPFTRMPPEKLASELMRGLARGKVEIAPGVSTPLKWLSRLLPPIAFQQMNK